MKTSKQIIAEKYIGEAIAITTTNIMKYLKLIQKDIGAKSIVISDVKNGLWQIGFMQPRHYDGNLYLLMKNKAAGTKISVSHVIGYSVSMIESDKLLDAYHILPRTIQKFSDLKMNMRVLQNLKGPLKDPRAIANFIDIMAMPDLEKEITKSEIKSIQTSKVEFANEMFVPFEDSLMELGVSKIDFDISKDIDVIKIGKVIEMFHSIKTISRINIKVNDKVAYILDFSKGSMNLITHSGNVELDSLINQVLSAYQFKMIAYVESGDMKIKSDLRELVKTIYQNLPSNEKSSNVISMIFKTGENMQFEIAKDSISENGSKVDESILFDENGLAGWVIFDTFIETSSQRAR